MVQITFVSRGHQPTIISQHIQNSQPTIPNDPTTSEPSAHASARPTTGSARRVTVSMLELGGIHSSALSYNATFSARPSETGRNSGFFLNPSAQTSCYYTCITSNAHWSALGGPTSASEAPPPLPRTQHRNSTSTTPYCSYAFTGILTQEQ